MIPAKNLFTGSLGKFQDAGGCRFFSTPHTVLVPYEYEINTSSQNSFVACSLDGRLWLFQDYCVAFKWNESTLRMQTAANIQVSNDRFIARGIDWILTQNYYIQVLDESPYIFRQQVSLDEGFTVSKFYSFLPALSDWQIINGFLIRRYGNEAGNALYSLSVPTGVYLTHKDNNIWGKDSSFIGLASISGDDDLSLEIAQTHSLSGNVSGLAFVGDDLYGFQLKQDSSLCPVSDNCLVYAPASGQWINTFNDEDNSGNIFFDPFNYAAVAVRDNQVNLLQEKKIFQAKGIAQWIAPTRNIAGVTGDFVIARLEHDILATHVNSGLYRESLHEKALALSSASYSGYKLAVGTAGNAVRFNQIQVEYKPKTGRFIKLIIKPVDAWEGSEFYWRSYDYFGSFDETDMLFFVTGIEAIQIRTLIDNNGNRSWKLTKDYNENGTFWPSFSGYMYEDDFLFYAYELAIRGRYFYINLNDKSLTFRDVIMNTEDKATLSPVGIYNMKGSDGDAVGYLSSNASSSDFFRDDSGTICLELALIKSYYETNYIDGDAFHNWGVQYTDSGGKKIDVEIFRYENISSIYQNWKRVRNNTITLLNIYTPVGASYRQLDFRDDLTGENFSFQLNTSEVLRYSSHDMYHYQNTITGENVHVIFLNYESTIKHILIVSNYEL